MKAQVKKQAEEYADKWIPKGKRTNSVHNREWAAAYYGFIRGAEELLKIINNRIYNIYRETQEPIQPPIWNKIYESFLK